MKEPRQLPQAREGFLLDDSGPIFPSSGFSGPLHDEVRAAWNVDPLLAEFSGEERLAQLEAFVASGVDLATAATMNHLSEAIGIIRAAADVELPIVISGSARNSRSSARPPSAVSCTTPWSPAWPTSAAT